MHQSLFLINNWINEKLIIFLNISNTLITVVDWKIWLKEKIEMNRIDIRLIKKYGTLQRRSAVKILE